MNSFTLTAADDFLVLILGELKTMPGQIAAYAFCDFFSCLLPLLFTSFSFHALPPPISPPLMSSISWPLSIPSTLRASLFSSLFLHFPLPLCFLPLPVCPHSCMPPFIPSFLHYRIRSMDEMHVIKIEFCRAFVCRTFHINRQFLCAAAYTETSIYLLPTRS